MPLTLRIVLAAVSGLAGIGAIYLILAPGKLPYERALELGAVTLLITVILLNTVWDAVNRPAPPAAAETRAGGKRIF